MAVAPGIDDAASGISGVPSDAVLPSLAGKISASQDIRCDPEPLVPALWGKALLDSGAGAPGMPPK